jgi:hypothetical protein
MWGIPARTFLHRHHGFDEQSVFWQSVPGKDDAPLAIEWHNSNDNWPMKLLGNCPRNPS